MANLKPKTPIFKSINGEMATGGAPIFADDLVRIQENERADNLNYFEALRRLLPPLLYQQGAGNPDAKEFENGLILSGLEYDYTNPAAPVVSEGYILSGGEVCYYPGGILSAGVGQQLLYLYKGAAVNTQRVFSGVSKDILVKYDVVVETSNFGTQSLPTGTAITSADEVVVLGITQGVIKGESYFTTQAALKIKEASEKLNRSAWTPATSFAVGVTFDSSIMPYMVSRVLPGNFTEIRGAVEIDFSTLPSPNPTLFNLSGISINAGVGVPVAASYVQDAFNRNQPPVVNVNLLGDVRLDDQGASFPSSGSGILVFNTIIYGNNTTPADQYEYKEDFLNIT